MNPVAKPVLDRLSEAIAQRSEKLGRRVDPRELDGLDRTGHLALGAPGRVSANGACRLLQARDGWIALNLAREEDEFLIPAWLERDDVADWDRIEASVASRPATTLVERGRLLGLPVSRVGEVEAAAAATTAVVMSGGGGQGRRAVDLSAMWAGPLCGAVLAAAGWDVIRIESLGRPDPTRTSTPRLFEALNGAKINVALDLRDGSERAVLKRHVAAADILITSARPAALERLGLTPEDLFAINPGFIWVAVTGYGWRAAPDRVAFGDDAAAAGGLVAWDANGPTFLGDALADPITGLAAAEGALAAAEVGGGRMVDASLAACAAGAASELGLARSCAR